MIANTGSSGKVSVRLVKTFVTVTSWSTPEGCAVKDSGAAKPDGRVGVVTMLAWSWTVIAGAAVGRGPDSYDASTARVAEVLFSPGFVYAFEAAAVLILAALVGAVVLAKRDF